MSTKSVIFPLNPLYVLSRSYNTVVKDELVLRWYRFAFATQKKGLHKKPRDSMKAAVEKDCFKSIVTTGLFFSGGLLAGVARSTHRDSLIRVCHHGNQHIDSDHNRQNTV